MRDWLLVAVLSIFLAGFPAAMWWVGHTNYLKILSLQPPLDPPKQHARNCQDPQPNCGNKHPEEFWERATSDPVAVFTLALTVVTAVLTGATIFLWRAAHKTWRSATESEQRSLRAYIGHMSKVSGAHFEQGVGVGSMMELVQGQFGRVKYFDWNYGKTPAHNVVMRVLIRDTRPDNLLTMRWEDVPPQQVVQIVHPQQNIGRIVGDQTIEDTFFLCGVVEYTDIFGERWRHRFAFSHDPRAASNGERWVADGTHNDEQHLDGEEWVNHIPAPIR